LSVGSEGRVGDPSYDRNACILADSSAARWEEQVQTRKAVGVVLLLAIFQWPALADDADIGNLLKAKGAKVTEAKGFVTALDIEDGSKLGNDDFLELARLSHLKTLSLSKGIDNARIAQLSTLANLEVLQTNLAQITDDGVKPLAQMKSLRNLKFFHPGKAFSGVGLAHLAEMPNLERLTVAGSLEFGDDGMAAVARLPHLKELRTWHAGSTNEGVKQLLATKSLRSLHLGQRLTYKLPACPNDETLDVLVKMTSLETLILDEARLSLPALRKLKGLSALKKLTLSGIDISKEDVKLLQSEWPSVKIEWTEPSETYQKRIRALFGNK
jgi:hypothetical protein